MKNLAIYLRVSTNKQDTNTSKETQMKTIDRYIEDHKLIFNKQYIYEDKYSASRMPKGSSIDDAKPFTRRGLNELLNDAKLNKFDTVMVFNHDRLTRNVQESLLLKYFFKKLNINLIYCKPGENIDTESEKLNTFFENLLNNLSALESNMIGSRTRLGNEYNIKKGYWAGGPPPYGYKLNKIYPDRKKSVLKIYYPEARVVIKIFDLYLQGLSPTKIAEYIKKTYSDNNDRKWTKNSVISIVKNKDYTGIMEWNKKGGIRCPIRHEDEKIITSPEYKENIIISNELWEQVKNIRAIQKKHPKFFSSPFLLNGFLVCGKCGKEMRAKNNGGDNGRVYYCIKEKEKLEPCIDTHIIEPKVKETWETCIYAHIIEPKVIETLSKYLTFLLSNNDNLNIFYEKYKTNFDSRKNIHEKAIAELQLQIDNNSNYISTCITEINILQVQLNSSEKSAYKTNSNFIESLKELHSYLIINGDLIEVKKNEIVDKAAATILSLDNLKKFIYQKKSLLDNIERNISDKELYRRSLKLLLYDFVDKIVLSEDTKSVEIIIK